MTQEDKQRQIGQLIEEYQAAADTLRHLDARVRKIHVNINGAAADWEKLQVDAAGTLRLGPSEVELPRTARLP